MRLMTAWSSGSRNSRGRGLPACGSGVTVPVSTKPKPSRISAATATASLSKPAARPIGLGNAAQDVTASAGSSGTRTGQPQPERL